MIGNLNKKIVLLFLSFLPLIGLGQDFDFHDIKKIDSEESFKRFALENLFSEIHSNKHPTNPIEPVLEYGYQPSTEGFSYIYLEYRRNPYRNMSTTDIQNLLEYSLGTFSDIPTIDLHFRLLNNKANVVFKNITDQIKLECTFYGIISSEGSPGGDAICYSCPSSKYKGKIGFLVMDGWGIIYTLDAKFIKE